MKLKAAPYRTECTCSSLGRSYCLYFLQIFSFEYLLLFNIVNTRHIKFGVINLDNTSERRYIDTLFSLIVGGNVDERRSEGG